MKTFLQEWYRNKATINDVIKDLQGMLNDRCWTIFFTHNNFDNPISYTSSLCYMRKTVHLSNCGYASSIYSEDLALRLIKDALTENITNIAKWLLDRNESEMNIFIFADGPIGQAVFKKDYTINDEISHALMLLKKIDGVCNNASGFMVEYIFPVVNH